jgi:hypothetical protein
MFASLSLEPQSPRTGGERGFHLIQMVDWLMLVSPTVAGKLVMVRRYRHGPRLGSLEVPGGLHDGVAERPEEGVVRY